MRNMGIWNAKNTVRFILSLNLSMIIRECGSTEWAGFSH